MATAVTNDSSNRARLTVDASGVSGGINWSASVTDNNASVGGFGDSGFWSITVAGTTVAQASGTYDFGSGVYPSPYFPRSQSGFVSVAPGTYSVTGTFRGNVGSTTVGTATIGTFNVSVPYPAPVWTDLTINTVAVRGNAYYSEIAAVNYVNSYAVVGGTFPPGLNFNTSNGVISGTPTTDGSYSFTVRANGTGGSIDANLAITVNPPLPVFTDATIQSIAIRGVAYSDGVSATNASSYSIASSSLPTGLSFNTSTGAITGTPTTLQSRSPVFRATNVTGSTDTPALSLTVNPPAPVFSDSTVSPSASIGSFYSDAVVASDVASYSVFSGALPDGITLNTSTGVISGTPTTAGDSTFVIRATNVTGSANTPSRTITVISPVRVWNGTDFAIGSLKVWNGSDFAVGVVRVWNGTTWVSAK